MSEQNFSYRVSGNRQGPWLTLSHPIGSSQRIWDAVLDALGQRLCVLTYDVRGHGGAPPLAGPSASFDDLAADCEALWDALGIETSHFVGLSLGGCIGVALATRAPKRLESLTVACSRLEMDDAGSRMWTVRAEQVLSEGMASIADATLDRWLSAEFRAAHPVVTEQVKATLLATSAEGFAGCARALAAGQSASRLSGLSMPVQYLAGTADKAVPLEHLRHYSQITPGASLVEVAGPHLLALENPQGFTQAVLAFPDRCSAERQTGRQAG